MIRSELVVTKRTPFAPRGLVVAEHPLGAEVGAAVLARGGNAVDAAVATAFAMTVVEPFMSTIAGSGTLLVHLARRGETAALDFSVSAPIRAHDGMYRLAGGVARALFAWPRVENDANAFGPLAVGVPGSVAGLALALRRWGTMELRDAVAPAVRLARDGFVADWYQALTTARYMEELLAFPPTARAFLREGRWIHRPPSMEPGDRVTAPDLARSLELIGREGPDTFYRGALGQALVAHLRDTGGLITADDLAAYAVRVDAPLGGRYRDVDLAFAPGATGGITALEILNVLAAFPARRVAASTADAYHLRAAAIHRAFQDRFTYLGDAAVVKGPWERLASAGYGAAVAREIRRGATGAGEGAGGDARARGGGDCTTHVSVVDRHRNMVSLTHTAVSLFGARMVVPGTGILLNNGMLWFDPEQGKPNSVAPGKRALVNMVPVLAFRRGRPYLTLGAPGGRRIISAIPQVLATLVDGGGGLQGAVEAPRLHIETDELLVDTRVGERVLAGLGRRGYRLAEWEETYATLNFAKPVGIRVTSRGLEAGLDHLRPAAAAGH
jgi:gamma-glutamyltranspeptidase / glutathione hydrolase